MFKRQVTWRTKYVLGFLALAGVAMYLAGCAANGGVPTTQELTTDIQQAEASGALATIITDNLIGYGVVANKNAVVTAAVNQAVQAYVNTYVAQLQSGQTEALSAIDAAGVALATYREAAGITTQPSSAADEPVKLAIARGFIHQGERP